MSNCPKCGRGVINGEMDYCPSCGTALNVDGSDDDPMDLAPTSGAIKHIVQATPKVTVGKVRHELLGEVDPPEDVTPPFRFESTPL